MNKLKNWDNKTWLSSKEYIKSFHNFLKRKITIDQDTKILDVGCGRANIISYLNLKYKFKFKPIGLDIVKNDKIKKNITFKNINAINYLNKSNEIFDLIIVKQTIHFFREKDLFFFLNLIKKRLTKKGKVFIFMLNNKNNEIPTFKLMEQLLKKSLEKDKKIAKKIKKKLKNYESDYFRFTVSVNKSKYIQMIKNRYISCLLNLSEKHLKNGIKEIKTKYNKKIKFKDILNCISYKN